MELKIKANILIVGILASLLFFFVLYVAFARFLNLTIVNSLENNFALFIIIFSMELIALVAAILVGVWQTDSLDQGAVFQASLFAFLSNILFISLISYIGLFIINPDIYSQVGPGEMILILPTVLVYFSIYGLGHPIYFIILSIFTYYFFFIIFLDRFLE